MPRAPIWDAAHPKRKQPHQAKIASLRCWSVHDSWRASSTPDVRHDHTNLRTIKNSRGWRFLRCNTTGQVLVEPRKSYLLILSKSRRWVSFGPLHAHFLTSCNGLFTSLITVVDLLFWKLCSLFTFFWPDSPVLEEICHYLLYSFSALLSRWWVALPEIVVWQKPRWGYPSTTKTRSTAEQS